MLYLVKPLIWFFIFIAILITSCESSKLLKTNVYDYLEADWNSKIPTKVFNGFFQDDLLREAKETNDNITLIFGFLGIVAFILSSLGLFTLVSINLIKRVKDCLFLLWSKVLGADLSHSLFWSI